MRRAAQQSPDGVPNGSIIGEGSGFVWSKAGYIVTNDHIVSNATQVLVIFSDRTEVAAEVVGTDPHSDLAVLRVDMLEDRLHPVTVGDSDALKVGQVTLADLSLRPAAIGGSGAMGNAPGSLPLNDETDYGLCFACGPRNRSGLHLRFQRDGGTVTMSFQGREEHQGFPGYVHGGVITALLDEIMSRVSLLEDRWTITARMEVRFRRPVMLDQRVTAVAEKSDERRGFIEATGRVVLPDDSDAAVASGTFAFLSRESLAKMSAGHPGLASQWMR